VFEFNVELHVKLCLLLLLLVIIMSELDCIKAAVACDM